MSAVPRRPGLRAILTRLFGRPAGTTVVPPDIDASTLTALAEGRLAPPFAHDAATAFTCASGWHLRRTTVGEAFATMTTHGGGRRRGWFRLPKRAGRVSEATVGELLLFAQLVEDGRPALGAYLCDACGRAVVSVER